MRLEISAGGVVYRKKDGNVEVGFILDPYGKWAFPKGHVEAGERTEAAAVREAEEEMGIKGIKVKEYLGKADFWFRDRFVRKGELVHKFLHYYLMESPVGVEARPQRKENIREVAWIPLEQAYKKSDYKDIEPLLRKAIVMLGGKVSSIRKNKHLRRRIRNKESR